MPATLVSVARCAKPGYPKGKRAAQVGVVGAPRGCAHTGFRAGYPKGRRPPVLYHWSRMVTGKIL